ncbi:MAG: hypothetical protein V1787_04765 [Candidatus Micrarchaeota archaeon]
MNDTKGEKALKLFRYQQKQDGLEVTRTKAVADTRTHSEKI